MIAFLSTTNEHHGQLVMQNSNEVPCIPLQLHQTNTQC